MHRLSDDNMLCITIFFFQGWNNEKTHDGLKLITLLFSSSLFLYECLHPNCL